MKKIVLSLIAFAAFGSAAAIETLTSPDGQIKLTFDLTPEGAPEYSVTYKGKAIVKPSTLGFMLKDDAPLVDRFKQGKVTYSSTDETWVPVWGENDSIANRYNEMTVPLSQKAGGKTRKMNIVFRAYDDGIGFRYVFPRQSTKSSLSPTSCHSLPSQATTRHGGYPVITTPRNTNTPARA